MQTAWQPIETAPRDGTHILGRSRHGDITSCRRWTGEQFAEAEGGYAHDYQEGWYDSRDNDDEVCPTHWMPLPDAPEQQPA